MENFQLLTGVATALTALYFLRKFFAGGVCYSKTRLDGKTVIVTGCNTGIGKETVRDMSKRGARVIMACRNLDLANKAANDIQQDTRGDIGVVKLDLASLKSVRACAKEILEKEDRIDILINNAGVMMCPFMKTEDDFEMQIGTNHLGHFLFMNLLLNKMKSGNRPARIVNLSSSAHRGGVIDLDDLHFKNKPYKSMASYGQSKLANILFTRELAKRLKGTKITTYAVHPGVVKTELGRYVADWLGVFQVLLWPVIPFLKTPAQGAQTSIDCAVNESRANESGLYYRDCHVQTPTKAAQDDEMAKKLWDLSLKEVGL